MLEFGTPSAFLMLLPWLAVAWRLFRKAPHRAILFSATHCLPPTRPSARTLAAALAPGLFLAGLAAGDAAAPSEDYRLKSDYYERRSAREYFLKIIGETPRFRGVVAPQ